MPIHAQIAEQLVSLLAAAELARPLEPARSYDPVEDLEKNKKLRCVVVSKSESRRRQTRATNLHTYETDVAVQQKIDPQNVRQGDELTELVEELATHVDRHWYLKIDGKLVDFLGCEIVLWLPRHIRELRQFTSVITFKFQLERKSAVRP